MRSFRRAPEPTPTDTFTGRPAGAPVPLRDCAAFAKSYAEDVLMFDRAQRRMNSGTPFGLTVPGSPAPEVVYKADSFETLAALARIIAGPVGSNREAKVRAYLRRLIADERQAAGASPHDAASVAADADALP